MNATSRMAQWVAAVCLCGNIASAQSTVFLETMGTVAGTTGVAAHEAADGFDNDAYTMTAGGGATTGDVRATSVSAGYTNSAGQAASGAANIFFSAGSERGFAIEGINSAPFSDLTIEFGYRKEASGSNAAFAVEWSTNSGAAWNNITLSNMPASNASVAWYLISGGLPPEASHDALSIRWMRSSVNGNSMRIDDVLVRGSSATAPEVIVTTANTTVPFETTDIDVDGTANANVVGELSWTNALTGLIGTIPASVSWTVSAVGLNVGTNLITVQGTNSTGLASQDSVTIIRSPAIVTNVQFTSSSATVAESAVVVTVQVYKSVATGNVSGNVALGGTATESSDYSINTTNFTMDGATTSALFEITIVDDGDEETAETVTLTIAEVNGGTIGSPSDFTLSISANDAPVVALPVWINEINYDTPGTDSNEFVELAGKAGTDLADYRIVLYNGAGGAVEATLVTSGSIPDEGCGYGALAFDAIGIQNGAPDGVALARVDAGVTSLVQFVSYEGSFAGVGGPADGVISESIGSQLGTVDTLQLSGTGTNYSQFTWTTNTISRGVLNVGQTIDPCGGSGYSQEQEDYIVTHWGSLGAYTGDDQDDDGDGFLNVEEFVAQTIPVLPNGATSYFRNVSIEAGTRSVGYPSVTGRQYRLWGSTNLIPGIDWTQVAGPQVGDGLSQSLQEASGTTSSVFRLTVELTNP